MYTHVHLYTRTHICTHNTHTCTHNTHTCTHNTHMHTQHIYMYTQHTYMYTQHTCTHNTHACTHNTHTCTQCMYVHCELMYICARMYTHVHTQHATCKGLTVSSSLTWLLVGVVSLEPTSRGVGSRWAGEDGCG